MYKELLDIIMEATNCEDETKFLKWEFFYVYKNKIMQCTLYREWHHYQDEMRALLLKHNTGAPQPAALENLFKECLPSAYKVSRDTPRMSFFQKGDPNGVIYGFSFLIRTAPFTFSMHKQAKESKYDTLKSKIHTAIHEAGEQGISKTDLFKGHSHIPQDQRDSIISELKSMNLITEQKINSKTMFFQNGKYREIKEEVDSHVAAHNERLKKAKEKEEPTA